MSLLALESFPSRSLLKYSHILFSNIFSLKKLLNPYTFLWCEFLYFYPTSEAIFLKSFIYWPVFSPVLLTSLPILGQYHIVLVTIPLWYFFHIWWGKYNILFTFKKLAVNLENSLLQYSLRVSLSNSSNTQRPKRKKTESRTSLMRNDHP